MSQIDVIIPVYNEAENVRDLFLRLDKALTGAEISYQAIFVDDHSTDGTVDQIYKLPSSKVKVLIKAGKRGKAYSIFEGLEISDAPIIAMIDGDLEYPPEALVPMFRKMADNGAVVARRQTLHTSWFRRLGSKINKIVFGKLLLGFEADIQSGLKMFRREVFDHVDRSMISGWAIDMPLLYTTLELGYTIGEIDIKFSPRQKGVSQLKAEFVKASFQIASTAIRLRSSRKKDYHSSPTKKSSVNKNLPDYTISRKQLQDI